MDTQIALANSAIKSMSSREISRLTGKQHKNVVRDIRNILDDLNLDRLSFEHTYYDSQNREQTEYLLDEELTITLVTGYSSPLRHAVIQRWRTLELEKERNELVSSNSVLSKQFREFMVVVKDQGETINLLSAIILNKFDDDLKALPAPEYMSVREFFICKGVTTLTSDEVHYLAIEAVKLSRMCGYEIREESIKSKPGKRNKYNVNVLQTLVNDYTNNGGE